jgi:hypothetical protein
MATLVNTTLFMLWPGRVLATLNHPVPYITNISPVSVAPGGAQFTLTVNGVNFIAASTVNWGSTALATTFVSNKQLTATVTAVLIATGGTGWITVTSPVPGGGTSNVLYLPVANSVSAIHMVSLSSTVGTGPLGLGEGDFNGDGMLDLAAVNNSSGDVTILLGNGDGTFVTHGTYAVGSRPLDVTVADVNGDGHLDLIVGHDTTFGPSVLLGDGTGTFVLQPALSTISNPEKPIVADIDHDGRPDIVVDSYNGTGVYFYKGNGDGTFQTAVSIGGSSSTFDVALADLNEDGNLDVIATHEATTNSMYIFLGNGNGTFQAPVVSTPIASAWSIALADLNKDGHLDIVISTRNGGGIVALLGNGDGTLQTPTTVVATGSYQSIAAGDLNVDGNVDIVGASNSTLQYIPGNGDGTFQASQSLGTISTSYGIVLGNFAAGGGFGVAAIGSGTTIKVFLQTLSLSPSPVTFGSVGVGTVSPAQTVTVANNTSSTVTISGISFAGTNPADFSQTSTCATPLVSAGTCTVSVTLTPGAVGARSAILSLADNAPGSPHTVPLSGTGLAVPVADLTPVGLVFATQHLGTASSAQTVTLSNSGGAALSSIVISIIGTNSADFGQTNTCGTTMAASLHCTILVTFTPSRAGSESALLNIADSAAGSPQTVALSGTGLGVPVADLAPVGLVFATQHLGTASSAQTATLSNSGGAALSSIVISIVGTNSADFGQTNTCGTTVAASLHCTILVTFTPSRAASENALLSIADSAAGSPQTVALSGTGVQTLPTITWANPAAMISGTALSATQMNATAGGVAGSFLYAPPTGTVLTVGTHTLSTTFTPADTTTYTSATAMVSVSVTSFGVSAPVGGVSAVPGTPASATITIPPLGGGFSGVVTLSATGLPAGATAVFSPPTITPGTTGATSTLAVTFPVTTAALIPLPEPLSIPTGLTSLAACCFFLRRKRLAHALRAASLLAILAGGLLTVTGCNGGFGAASRVSAPRTIVVTVIGTSGTLSVSTTVTFNVR